MGKLLAQSILGLLFLVAVLGLALFLSAGTLSYWQAWLYLAVWVACVLPITIYLFLKDPGLLSSRVQAGPVAETRKSQQVIQSFASLFFILLYIIAGLDQRFHWSTVPPILSIVSDLFVALGFYFVFLVFKENSFTSATIEVKESQKVISTGPYSLVRHPMYAGAFLLLLFTPTALGSWVALPFPIPLIFVIVIRLLDEEKFLSTSLEGYTAYRHKVRYRLIPYIW